MQTLSIIIPTFNEAETIVATLKTLQTLRHNGHEIIVVDGNSKDKTIELAKPYADQLLQQTTGRATQMHAGAKIARGDILLFLHADTQLPKQIEIIIQKAIAENQEHYWGRFNIKFTKSHWLLNIVSYMINLRSEITGIATGDQAIFIQRKLYRQLGGFPQIPLMEDIAFSKLLLSKKIKPICLKDKAITSSRRWEKHGILRTILTMWWLRFSFSIGISPQTLAKQYYPHNG